MKGLRRSSLIIIRKSVLTCRKAELAFLVFFFLSRFSFTNIHDSQGSRGGLKLSLYTLPTTPPVSETLRHLPGYCRREL